MKKKNLLPLLALALFSCKNEDDVTENLFEPQSNEQAVNFSVDALYSTNHRISPDDAKNNALRFVEMMSKSKLKSVGKSVSDVKVLTRSGALKSGKQDTVAYIVNFSNSGSAICSADDRVPSSVIALFDNDFPGLDDENFNFVYGKVQSYIDYSIEDFEVNKGKYRSMVGNQSESDAKQLKATDGNDYEIVGPLIATKWNQDAPFNDAMPKCVWLGCNNKALTGCGAVAMGQILNYYKKPNRVNGVSINWNSIESGGYKTLLKNIGEKINIENHCINHGGTPSSEETWIPFCEQINYSIDYKGYNKDVISECLENGNPLLVWGLGDNLPQYGHAWIIDGYCKCRLFKVRKKYYTVYLVHCNWGWGGDCDGWFQFDVLNPKNGASYDVSNLGTNDFTFNNGWLSTFIFKPNN